MEAMRVVTLVATRVPSPLGTLVLMGSKNGLCRLDLPGHVDDERLEWAKRWVAESARIVWKDDAHARWRQELRRYFLGKAVSWAGALDLRGTGFQLEVWRQLLTIPRGQTQSYGSIAKDLNCGSAQAIGQAVHVNPLSIVVPCHRVIGSDGSLVGYAGGLETKRYLLALEHGLESPGLFDTIPPKRKRGP